MFLQQFGLFIFVVTLMDSASARPNPVTDELSEGSESEEESPYKYPDFKKATEPYWRAFPKEYQWKMKEHDRLEINMLAHLRSLDFKLREAWTVTDKPFNAS